MVTVLLSAGWAHRGQKSFECREGTVRDVIKEFVETYPVYRRRLLDDTGEPLTYYNVYLDGDLVENADRSRVTARSDSTVAIIPPLAGG
ncbi:MoaD/ThiS family protein [Micromonospora sp. NPDC047670]|uniref:MoaD/ThiS family protein n=1 Tax=unclassified Micromonospora TaxID=2617518 RepID=UPI0037147B1E